MSDTDQLNNLAVQQVGPLDVASYSINDDFFRTALDSTIRNGAT